MSVDVAIPPSAPAVKVVSERRAVYVQAGQLAVAADPSVITTILGSCVAICLWDPVLRVGGMNHYMLPFLTVRQSATPRFGTVAWQSLISAIGSLGVHPRNLRAGIFGGACVMEVFRGDAAHIGMRNVELAEQQLADAGIPVVQREVGGRRGRKLIFETDTGQITVKEL